MKTLRNEKGFALGFVLILSVIGLLMTLAMLVMVSRGGYVSGQQKRFRTAVEAGVGGVQSMFQLLDTRGNMSALYGLDNNASVTMMLPIQSQRFAVKINNRTGAWGAGVDNTLVIVPGDRNTYDIEHDVGRYTVYMKLVDTVEGNSAGSEGLVKSGVVNAGSGEVSVPSIPYLYTIEVLSQNRTNANERSRISILYQY